MVDAQTVGVLVTAASVTVAAIYYVMTLRSQQSNMKTNIETRQAQLFMSTFQSTYSKDWQRAQRKVYRLQLTEVSDFDKIDEDEDLSEAFYIIASYLEGIGVLVRENLIDIRIVSELISGIILRWWALFGPGVIKCREAWGFPRYCIEIEYLAERVTQYGKEHPELGILQKTITFYDSKLRTVLINSLILTSN